VPAVPYGKWQIGIDQQTCDILGCVTPNNKSSTVNTSAGSVSGVTVQLAEGNAGFYGKVTDGQNNPLPAVRLQGDEGGGSGAWKGDATSDPNGNYFMAVVAGDWDCEVEADASPAYASFLFSQAPFSFDDGNSGTNLDAGAVVAQSYVGITATNLITGALKDNSGNPIGGVGISAMATINGVSFTTQDSDTDSNGQYSITVGNGYWTVSPNCCSSCGNDGLPNTYQCPGTDEVGITNDNGVANFIAEVFSSFISGRVITQSGAPVTNMNIFAYPNGGNDSIGQGTTDYNGNYSMGVGAGDYFVELNTAYPDGAPAFGLVSPNIPVTVTSGVNISNLVLVAMEQTGAINASVTNATLNAPVTFINISASATINGTNYTAGTQTTGANGEATLVVCNGTWDINADCGDLDELGDSCPDDIFDTISNDSLPADFQVTSSSGPPSLASPSWRANQFQCDVSGSVSQDYKVQYTTNLASTNWILLLSATNTQNFSILDANATNSQRFYRVIASP
jgi:hypothetical protein